MTPELRKHRAAFAGWALGALGAGLLHALSFGPLAHWSVGLCSLAVLFGLVFGACRCGLSRGAITGLGWLFGWAHFSLGLAWLHHSMHHIGGMPFALSVLAVMLFAGYLALYPALALALSHGLIQRTASPVLAALALAASWWLAEAARGWVLTGFPWLSVGYGQIDGPLAGWAALAGVHGVSALSVLVAALVAGTFALPRHAGGWDRLQGRRWMKGPKGLRAIGLALVIVLASPLVGIGPQRWVQDHGAPLHVQLLQGNVPQDLKFIPQRTLQAMEDYLQAFERSKAAMTVLPETAWTVPWSMTPPEITRRVLDHVQKGHALAIGLPRWSPGRSGGQAPSSSPDELRGLPANSVMLLASGIDPARAPIYDKHHLVPFGEFVPWGFAWFVRQMQIPLGDFLRGDLVQPPFEVGGQKVAMNICYEDLFGEEIRQSVLHANASILANVSNLGWFGRSSALDQHLAISRFRSIETGRPMVRATNTGMTAAIDHRGEVMARLEPHAAGALEVRIQGMQGLTPYARFGQGPWLLVCLLILGLIAIACRTRPTGTS